MVTIKRCLATVFLMSFLLVLFVNLVSANFTVGNKAEGITTSYGPGESISGWVNISLDQEPADSLFTDSRSNSIKLIDLLKKRTTHVYTCSPGDCSSSYVSSNGEIAKTFNLNKGETKSLGLRVTGDVAQINPIAFDVTTNASAACENQISVDFLDDGVIDVVNDKSSGSSCSGVRSYGCYVSSAPKEELKVEPTPYCQRINLSNAPGFKLGTVIKKNSGSMSLEASLYDGNTRLANCNLPDVNGEVSCDVSYVVSTPKDYYVCISAVSGSGDYKIMGNTAPAQGCGFFGQPLPTSTPGAYEIFAEPKGFAAPGNIHIPNSLPNGKNLATMAYNYIISKYGNTNCATECIIPIKIIAGTNQQTTASSLSFTYQKSSGVVTDTKFYELATTGAKISSGFSPIYLDGGNFSVPSSIGTYKFSLKLSGKDVVNKDVNITSVPKIVALNPTSTAAGFPTDFGVTFNTSALKRVFWEFGDNTTDVTTINVVRHTYNTTGIYPLTVTVTDTRDLSSTRTFTIDVTSPKALINTTIAKIKSNVNTLKASMNSLTGFSQESVNSYLSVDKISQDVTKLEANFNAATTDAQYSKIITDLLKMNDLPKSVSEGRIASSITVFPDRDSIDLDEIKRVAGGDYNIDEAEDYKDAIILWNQDNLETTVTFKEIFGNYGTEIRPVVRVFELNIQKKTDVAGTYFLFLPKLKNLTFAQGTPATEEGNYYYVDLGGIESVSFYTTEEIDFIDLPYVVSPGLNRITVTHAGAGILGESKPKWIILILILIFLLAVGFIVYIVLQEWYKRRYENYLFKNRNDLYNMVNYIHNAKNRGQEPKQIEDNLRKAKWKSEQIKYVMKKYSGQRTGMFEIPILKFFKKKITGTTGNLPKGYPGTHPGYHKKI